MPLIQSSLKGHRVKCIQTDEGGINSVFPLGECATRYDSAQLPDQSFKGARSAASVLCCLQAASGTE